MRLSSARDVNAVSSCRVGRDQYALAVTITDATHLAARCPTHCVPNLLADGAIRPAIPPKTNIGVQGLIRLAPVPDPPLGPPLLALR